MKNWTALAVILLLAALSGCAQTNASGSDEIKELKVSLNGPIKVDLNKSYHYTAHVTYGDQKVEDAKVEFEVVSSDGTDEMKKATAAGNGDYKLDYTFRSDSIYSIQSHVSARDQHNMPKIEIMAGKGGKQAMNMEMKH
ncbi:FixH family protein [Metabacillus sp. RGM 3146]|uniref:FixH family protein n=1 Tax=Metabacillus sp. RGM 3146 TaxID=3401092 RepID=UPI003B9D509C